MHSIRIKISSGITSNLVVCLFLIVTLVNPITLNAQTTNSVNSLNPTNNLPSTYTLLEPLPCLNGDTTCTSGQQVTDIQFKDYVTYVFNLIIALAAVAAVFMIVLGGFQYMSSDSYSGKSEGLKKLQNALLGLLLVLSSYLILRTIDPRLVEIPSTLVPKLDIKYDPDELSSYMKQLLVAVNADKNYVRQLMNQNNEIRSLIDAKNKERSTLCDKLESGEGNCDYLMRNPSLLDPVSQALVAKIANIDNEIRDLQVKKNTNMAVGLMNTQIQSCNAIKTAAGDSNLNTNDCLNEINAIQSDYRTKLDGIGADAEAKKVEDYGIYASAITKINTNTLIIMASDPYVKATIDSWQNSITAGGIIGGAAGGGVIGAGSGFIVSQGINSVITAAWNGEKLADAQRAIATIQLEVNNTKDKITDPQIREHFINQSYSLIKSLGGKGDGTDSTVKAAPQAGYIEAKPLIKQTTDDLNNRVTGPRD